MDDLGLEGKVALIAGGGSKNEGIGNGRAAAVLLARAGAKVAVMDRKLEAAERTVTMIKEEGKWNKADPFVGHLADALEPDQVKILYPRLASLEGTAGAKRGKQA